MNLFARTVATGESFTRVSDTCVGYYTRFAAFLFLLVAPLVVDVRLFASEDVDLAQM